MPKMKIPEKRDYYQFGRTGANPAASALFYFGFIEFLPGADQNVIGKDLVDQIKKINAKKAELSQLEDELSVVAVKMAKYINANWTPQQIHTAFEGAMASNLRKHRPKGGTSGKP